MSIRPRVPHAASGEGCGAVRVPQPRRTKMFHVKHLRIENECFT